MHDEAARKRGKTRWARGGSRGSATPGWLPEMPPGSRTKYASLVRCIRDAVASGDLSEGDALPPQRKLAAHLGMNTATVSKAIAEARRLGLVATRQGGGTRVLAATKRRTLDEAPGNGAIDLSINIPPVSVVGALLDDVLPAIARRHGTELLGYRPLGGTGRDREIAAEWLSMRGVVAAPQRVAVTQGAHEALFAAISAVTTPGAGDIVLCESLNYTGIRRLGDACAVTLSGVETDERGMLPEALAEACRKQAPKALICTPVTLNPTTATQDRARREEIIGIAKRYSISVIEDDIYGALSGDSSPTLATLWPDGVIYVCGLSKCVAPGLRIGYVAHPEALSGRLRDALLRISWLAPSLHIAIANELIQSGLARTCVEAHREEARRRMKLAREILRPWLATTPAATYHAWMRVPAPWGELDAAGALRERGVIVSPAQDFALPGHDAPSAVRLGLGAAADLHVLERSLRIIAEVLGAPIRDTSTIV